MMFSRLSTIALLCAFTALPAPSSSQTSEEMRDLLRQWSEVGRLSAHVLIVRDDTTIINESFGFGTDVKSAPPSVWLIGSVTKPFIAYGVKLLADRGALSYYDTIDKWFSDFPSADSITIQMLLDHQAGLSDYRNMAGWKDYEAGQPTPRETIERMKDVPQHPRGTMRYSNVGYIMLGVIIEEVSNQKIVDFVGTEIAAPLHLDSTGVAVNGMNGAYASPIASGFQSSPYASRAAVDANLLLPFTSGNMYSTPHDLHRFMTAMIHKGVLPTTSAKDASGSPPDYHNGWAGRRFGSTLAYGHYGAMSGYVCSITWLPEQNAFLVLCGNDDYIPFRQITADLVQLMTGGVPTPPAPETYSALTQDDIHSIVGRYETSRRAVFTVTHVADRFFLTEGSNDPLEMFPVGGGRFVFVQLERAVHFEGSDDGPSPWFELQTLKGDQVLVAMRTDAALETGQE